MISTLLGSLFKPPLLGVVVDYAQKAAVMKKVRHMYVDVMNAPDVWQKFARKVKSLNLRRPAFQEEFAKLIPGWKDL